MLSSVSFLTLLCLLGSFQGVLLAIAVGSVGSTASGFRRSNRLLAVIFLGAATVLTVILLSHRNLSAERASAGGGFDLELVEYSLWVFAGPLFLLYVSLVTARDEWPSRSFVLHFAPGGIWLAYVVACLAGLVVGPRPPPAHWMMLYQVAYTLAALRLWRRTAARSRVSSRSPASDLHSFWVPALCTVLLIQHGAQLVRWLFRHEPVLRDVVPLAGAASFVALTLFGLRRAIPLLGKSQRRYAGSTLTPERAAVLSRRLEEIMERDRLYLEPELSLETLAATLEVPKTHLSQVVNENLGLTYLDFLAGYRVRESVRLLSDDSSAHLTIEAVARRSGFNSRSTFYEAFRRYQGGTPTDFRRQVAES